MLKLYPPSRKTCDSLTCGGGGKRGLSPVGRGCRLLLTGIKSNIAVSADVVHFLHGWGGGLGLLTVGIVHHVLVGHLPRKLGH